MKSRRLPHSLSHVSRTPPYFRKIHWYLEEREANLSEKEVSKSGEVAGQNVCGACLGIQKGKKMFLAGEETALKLPRKTNVNERDYKNTYEEVRY